MKILYLTRHAKSSWTDPLLADIERPLNDRGLRDIGLMPDYFLQQGETKPEFIVSSPAKRAQQTAKAFLKELGISKSRLTEEKKLYHANVENIYNVIFGLPDDFNCIMLFGHNPGFTEMANIFADHNIENVPTCGIFRLDADIENWNKLSTENTTLTKFYFPKQFIK